MITEFKNNKVKGSCLCICKDIDVAIKEIIDRKLICGE